MEFLAILNPWHWWMLAALLLAAELLAPCAYFMGLAIPSAIVGLAWKIYPGLTVEWQLGLFVGLSIITLGLAYRRRSRRPAHADSAEE